MSWTRMQCAAVGGLLALLAPVVTAQAEELSADPFGGLEGCFLLADLDTGQTERVGGALCEEPLPPCSTFKVLNALIGLDTGVLAGPETAYAWDGQPKGRREWEQDHTLRTAFRDSVVWYFERVAREVGQARMQAYLDLVGYGDRRTGPGLFWIDGTLRVTAREQLDLMTGLYQGGLPFSPAAQRVVRGLMDQADGHGGLFGGKTGTGLLADRPGLGWFVGHAARGGREVVFVLAARPRSGDVREVRGADARELARALVETRLAGSGG
jgi:beta-lactamase class D